MKFMTRGSETLRRATLRLHEVGKYCCMRIEDR